MFPGRTSWPITSPDIWPVDPGVWPSSRTPVDVTKYANNDKNTYVMYLLDSSGSMLTIADTIVEGFNEQVDITREKGAKGGQTFVSLIVFNHDVYDMYFNKPYTHLEKLSRADYQPRGGTALLDAIGYTITKMEHETNLSDPKNRYLLINLTDGAELDSKHFSKGQIASRFKELQKNRWTITYMGCNQDMLAISREYGIPKMNTMSFTAGVVGARGAVGSQGCQGTMGKALSNYYETVSLGGQAELAVSSNFYNPETVGAPVTVVDNK